MTSELAAENAEFVVFGVGKDCPARAVGIPVIGDQGGTEAEQPFHLRLTLLTTLDSGTWLKYSTGPSASST
ncbi:hypothetical protein ADK59_33140 [Streptomyces sp. XY332]|nr:hypothetical protein ADK59_33140 [Streptomyces sp. XY332]